MGGWSAVPRIVTSDRRLSKNARLVFATLQHYCWTKLEAFPTQATLALEIGCSARTIKRAVRELRERNLVKITRKKMPGSNHYHLVPLVDVYSESEQTRCVEGKKGHDWATETTARVPLGLTVTPSTTSGAISVPSVGPSVSPQWGQNCPSNGDEASSLREEEQDESEHKTASPSFVWCDSLLSIREESARSTQAGGRFSDREKMVPGRERTYVSSYVATVCDVVAESPVVRMGYGSDKGYDGGPAPGSAPRRALPEPEAPQVTKPVVKAPSRAPQTRPVTAQMPAFDVSTKALPVVVKPASEEKPAACNNPDFVKLYGIWRAEIDARFGKTAVGIPTKAPFKDFKLKTCAAALMAKFVEDEPAEFSGAGAPDVTSKSGSRPNFTVLHSMIRVAIWDWSSIRESAAGKWVALDLKLPTLREVHLLADYLASNIQTGIVGGTNNRTSAYLAKFVSAAPETPTDAIGRIAKLENKSRAAVMREVKEGRVLG